jgi:F-type H+-transporting ATPase subunit b
LISKKLRCLRAQFPIWIAGAVLGFAVVSPAQAAVPSANPAGTYLLAQAETSARPDSPLHELHQAQKEEETDETAAYRHSPSVQWFAKVLHVDVETAAKLFEYINFAVILLAIGIPLFKMLPKKLRQRSETLSRDLESARTATADANARLSAVEAKLAGLDAEIEAIRKQVEVDMREDEARVKASIAEESARIVAAAEQEIQVAASLIQRELKEFAADLAIDGALSRLTLNADTDRALIAEFAAGNAGKAGQN